MLPNSPQINNVFESWSENLPLHEKYAMIDQLKSQHAVQRLCQQLNVAVSAYLAHGQGRPDSKRKQQDQRLLAYNRAAHAHGRGIYGPLKIQSELAAQGIRCTHKKKFRVITDSKHLLSSARSLLDRQFDCTAPNEVWVADITYIPTGEGWLYLAADKDLYTFETVGWSMDNRMTQRLVMDALTEAYWNKKPAPGLMHHSDRSSQYCSAAYRALQASYGMQTSMSRKGSCCDNAPMKNFFGAIKTERLQHYRFKTREHAKRVIFEYIEVFL